MASLRQKTIFDQFNMPDMSGGSLGYGLDQGTSFMPGADSPTYEDAGTFRSSNLKTDFRTPEDIRGIGASDNISKVSNASTEPDYYQRNLDIVNKLYTPSEKDTTRYSNLLDNTPDVNDYNPSFMRKFASSLQSIKDPVQGQKTLNQPYLQDMAQWTAKTGPYQSAATLENQRNINERTLATNMASNITTAERNAATAKNAEEKIRVADEKTKSQAEIARMKNQSYNAAVQGRSIQWDTSGPTVLMREGNKITDTGVSTGHMTEMDKIELQNAGRIDAAEASGRAGVDRAVASAQAAGKDLVVIDNVTFKRQPDGSYAPAQGLPVGTPTVPSAPKTSPVESEANKQKKQQARLQDIFLKDPNAQQWGLIVDDGSGIFKMSNPPTNEVRRAKWNQIHDAVYGPTPDLNTPPAAVPPGAWVFHDKNMTEWTYSIDGGKTWKYSPDGGKTWRAGADPRGK